MAKSPQALIEPELLLWARNSARMSATDVAKRLRIAEDRFTSWESGDGHPSISQLRKLAALYHRPLALFFLAKPPLDFEPLRDFRRLQGETPSVLSIQLQSELRRAQELREAALSLISNEGEETRFSISVDLGAEPEQAGALVRSTLGIADDTQLSWNGGYEALREWRSATESLGVLVVSMSGVAIKDARGFSISQYPLPLIALNPKDTPNGRIFTLMHELAHLALHEGGICDWSPEESLATTNRPVEVFCNQVAAATLLPAKLVVSLVGSPHPAPNAWPDELLEGLARSLCVSEEAILRRLVTLGLASQSFYNAKRVEYIERYAAAARKVSKPIVKYEKRVVGSLGNTYLDLAFGAYYDRRLSLSELSSYTGVRVANLAKVEREAFGISRISEGSG